MTSPHSVRTKRRFPKPVNGRKQHVVSHFTFELAGSDKHCATFALIPGFGEGVQDRKPLFTGTVDRGMADELEALAKAVRRLEPRG